MLYLSRASGVAATSKFGEVTLFQLGQEMYTLPVFTYSHKVLLGNGPGAVVASK